MYPIAWWTTISNQLKHCYLHLKRLDVVDVHCKTNNNTLCYCYCNNHDEGAQLWGWFINMSVAHASVAHTHMLYQSSLPHGLMKLAVSSQNFVIYIWLHCETMIHYSIINSTESEHMNLYIPLWDLSSCNEASSVSLGLLTSRVVKLRSLSILLDRTRSSAAAFDFCFVPLLLGFVSPLVVCLEGRNWGCLMEELLLPIEIHQGKP